MPGGDLRFFDEVAPRYDAHWIQRFAQPLHARMLAALEMPCAVLDVGCGTGALLAAIGARWPRADLAGIDAAPGMVAMARNRLPSADIREGTAEGLPWPDATFDLVVTSLSFHHWRDQTRGIGEAARVLRPGGRFLLGDIGGDGLTGLVIESLRRMARNRDAGFPPSARIAAAMSAVGLGPAEVVRWRHFRLVSGRRSG
jgi:ubiquinone/menaquinone biosynthesis C-methylase UbiE